MSEVLILDDVPIDSVGPAKSSCCNKLISVCSFILVVEMCERLCYYTLGGSQRNFLEVVGPTQANGSRGMQASAAVSISACWSMLSYCSCILGGYLADNRMGRYRTILFFSFVYVIGTILVTVSAMPRILSTQLALPLYFVGSFVFVTLGTGAIKPNVMNFGADQYDVDDPQELEEQTRFFSYFYLAINVGAIVALGYCSNLATSGSTDSDPGSGYFKSYLIASCAMGLAGVTFLLGTPRYSKTEGVTHTPMIRVIIFHLRNAAARCWRGKLSICGWMMMPVAMVSVLVGSLAAGNGLESVSGSLSWGGMAVVLLGCACLIGAHFQNDYLIEPDTDTHQIVPASILVEDVRKAMSCVPTIICINVGFNMLYNSMNNAYPIMACQMDTRIFGQQLNGSFFSLGDSFAIIVFIPIFEKLIFPLIRRMRGGRHVTRWAKYTTGFLFGMAANLSASILETIRRDLSSGESPHFVPCPSDAAPAACSKDGRWLLSQCSPNASLPMTQMSAFWTLLPMALTGLGEILVNPVVYQFVFEEAPPRLRSLVQALNLVFSGAISNVVTAALGPMIPEDLNTGNVTYFFYVNTFVAGIFLILYWCTAASASPHAEQEVNEVGVPASFVASEARGASLLGSSFLPGCQK